MNQMEKQTLRAIAIFEAMKGIAAFAVVVGVIDLMHHNVKHLAIELIGRFGLNPGSHYPSLLLHYADLLPGANVRLMVLLASGYILLRLLEAYGLWKARAWGEYLGALSCGLYIPFEISHLLIHPSGFGLVVVLINAFLVSFLTIQLWKRKRCTSQH